MNITITERERELLVRVVEHYYANLREEIYKTEGHEFKERLKHEESAIKSLLVKLRT